MHKTHNINKKGGTSFITILIVIIITVIICFFVFYNMDNIKNLFNTTIEQDTNMDEDTNLKHIGDIINAKGMITSDGDLKLYTHRLHTSNFGTIGIKSRTIDLGKYEGEIEIEGRIEDINAGIYIVEVISLKGKEKNIIEKTNQTGNNQTGKNIYGKYIENAGLYLQKGFFDEYKIKSINNDVITISSIDGTGAIDIDYFRCDNQNPNENCSKLRSTFENISEKSFENIYGIKFYKLSEVKSWFFGNKNYFGYFVNDAENNEVVNVGRFITFMNNNYIDANIIPDIQKICGNEEIKILNVDDYNVKYINNQFIANIKGVSNTGTFECKIILSPDQAVKGKKENLTITKKEGEIEIEENDKNTEDKNDSDKIKETKSGENKEIDFSVEQFPIDLDNTYEFKSRRGHTIIFPAGNISFAGETYSEDFGQNGVNCFSKMKVAKYQKDVSEEEKFANIGINIYECNLKNDFEESQTTKLISVGDKNFVVEIVDPAWKDFADNVEILLNQ